jgi:hypothetical protein
VQQSFRERLGDDGMEGSLWSCEQVVTGSGVQLTYVAVLLRKKLSVESVTALLTQANAANVVARRISGCIHAVGATCAVIDHVFRSAK